MPEPTRPHDDPGPPVPSPTPSGLGGDDLALWRAFLAWSEGVTARVAQALQRTGVSTPDYEVLRRLSEAGEVLARQGLEEWLGWSPSRLSHQLRRMEERGLLRRVEVGRGRAVRVELSEPGRRLVAAADEVHARAVRAALVQDLPPAVAAFLLARGTGAVAGGRAS